MSVKRSLVLYIFFIGICGFLIWLVIHSGQDLIPNNDHVDAVNKLAGKTKPVVFSSEETLWEQFSHNIKSPLGILLLQIITILFVSKLFGNIITRFRQPSVVGEMIAGIFLGPSIVGFIFPEFSSFVFPNDSLANLQFLSQIGLAFFMFIIGMELDIEKLKNKAHNAIVISHVSIIFPYLLGVSTAYLIYESFAPANVGFTVFALFIGIAVSITAFPVLARILQERKLTKTSLGAIVIACAAFDDVTAWCILAMVIAIAKAGSIVSALFTMMLTFIFVLVMIYGVRRWMDKAAKRYTQSENLNKTFVVLVFFVLLVSAYITETIGIHALFGAFLAGVIMPHKSNVKEMLMSKIEDVSILLLLPIFFAFTGLRTQIGLLNEMDLWITCGLIIFVAMLGKLGGSAAAARLTGYNWKDSLSIGALMNTRGLMELIVLNIGYDLGILSPTLFTIFVIMALATTFMTGPLLDVIEFFWRKKSVTR